MIFLVLILIIVGSTKAQNIKWVPTNGPYTSGAYQSSVSDSLGNIFLSTEYGGIFRSTNNGDTWTHSLFLDIYASEMHTDYFGNVFAGVFGEGILRTTDAGITWEEKNSGIPNGYYGIAFANIDSDKIFIGTHPPDLFISSNQGENWIRIQSFPTEIGSIGAIEQLLNNDLLLGSIDSGLFRSTDYGITWFRNHNFPQNLVIKDIEVLNSGNILIGTYYGGLFRSIDNGYVWSNVLNGYFFTSIGESQQGKIYACSGVDGLYRSLDDGNNWEYIGIDNQAIRSMVCQPDGDVFVFAASGGPYRLLNNSNELELMNIPTLVATSLLNNGEFIFVGSERSVFRTSDVGQSWEAKPISTLVYNTVFDLLETQGYLFAALLGSRVWRSSNNGDNWERVLTATFDQPDCYSLASDRFDNIYAGIGDYYYGYSNGTIFKSSDIGDSWIEVKNNLPPGTPLKIISTSNNTILSSINGYGIYRSSDSGENWEYSSYGLPNPFYIAEALYEDVDNRKIYCGTYENGIYVSTDDGINWNESNSGISSERVTDIVMDNEKVIYISTLNYVFKSTDHGSTWFPEDSGLTNPIVWALTIDKNNYIHSATLGTGLFKSLQPVTNVDNNEGIIQKSYFLSQNYPNPFNSSTTIKYSIPKDEQVIINLINVLGEKVIQLVNEHKSKGDYKLEINLNNLVSGIYFYQIKAGTFSQTMKMILLK